MARILLLNICIYYCARPNNKERRFIYPGDVFMVKNYSALTAFFCVICFLFIAASNVNATYLVYPDDPHWTADIEEDATAAISDANPRGYYSDDGTWIEGNASLALTTSGNTSDWAFYTRYAGYDEDGEWDGSTWGLLSEIEALSFDWYRETGTEDATVSWDPWYVQTPALRLLLEYAGELYELVWEAYYDFEEKYFEDDTLEIGSWVSEDLIEENFWLHVITGEAADTYSYYDDETGSIYTDYYTLNAPYATSLSEWISYFAGDVVVYGLSVGVGNSWAYEYTGYVDNIYLSFEDSDSTIITALNDNFELPVPEPTTLLLFGSGIGVMALRRKLLRRKGNL